MNSKFIVLLLLSIICLSSARNFRALQDNWIDGEVYCNNLPNPNECIFSDPYCWMVILDSNNDIFTADPKRAPFFTIPENCHY